MGNRNYIEVNKAEFDAAINEFDKMIKAIDESEAKKIQRRYAKKHFVGPMKTDSHSARLMDMISVTTAKRYTPPWGVRVGVVKNDKDKFPKFSAQGLAAVIEYGTAERYRSLRRAGIITGRVSTGAMPAAPWLRKNWDMNVRAFMNDVQQAIYKQVLG